MNLTAKWIWTTESGTDLYNETVIAKKLFTCAAMRRSSIAITADSYYRLLINDKWVGDGPCRAWPEHYQYDELDISPYLDEGENEIKIIAQFYGCGHFKGVPRRPGLLAQVEIEQQESSPQIIISDSSWEIAQFKAYKKNVPKDSIQMSPFEYYDARLENDLRFRNAVEICGVDNAIWQDLHSRDVALLTKNLIHCKSLSSIKLVKSTIKSVCIPAARLLYPELIEANIRVTVPFGIATIIKNEIKTQIKLTRESLSKFKCSLDGIVLDEGGIFDISPGEHLFLAFAQCFQYHLSKHVELNFDKLADAKLANPLEYGNDNPWCFIPFAEYCFSGNDLIWDYYRCEPPGFHGIVEQYNLRIKMLLSSIKNIGDLVNTKGLLLECLPYEKMCSEHPYMELLHQKRIGDAAAFCEQKPDEYVIEPAVGGDLQLCYDLGEQNCGYYQFEITADEGTVIDIASVEYISTQGKIQHTVENCNSMRYVAKHGRNIYTSLKRRSGRYLLLTLRNQKAPVYIHRMELIESVYPIRSIGSFGCSNDIFPKIWDICVRTLKLCMEDTYVDCPLYEQTFWTGDARNESIFGYNISGATDIALRGLRLAAQSLDRFPIVGCQVPSSWQCLIPSFSCLWGISVWEYYWYSGDKSVIQELLPYVEKNLKGLAGYTNNDGLFEAKMWNFIDWTKLDSDRDIVLHNSMFVVGAIDAALKCFDLCSRDDVAWINALREKIICGLSRLWDHHKNAWPDSIHANGQVSESISQHTSFLSVLYDIADPKNRAAIIRNIVSPPEGMVRVGTPYAMMFLLEALDKIGMREDIVEFIMDSYSPMLEAGATTVWESFPSGTTGKNGFPTRSHCHAFSAFPLYFIPRIILGIRQTSAGGQSFEISPYLSGLSWAKGTVATIKGPLSVEWQKSDNLLNIKVKSPDGINVKLAKNTSIEKLQIRFNSSN
jgi:hypothetical protein